jgi:uncharacterized protein with PQ loop repeat
MSVAAVPPVVSIPTITFLASSLGVVGPAAQLWRVLQTRSTQGLSRTTFTILTVTFMLSLLLGIQYKIGPALILAGTSVVIKWLVLVRIDWRNAAILAVAAAFVSLVVVFGPTGIGQAVLSTRYSELVAFAWGLLFAITFLPQVLLTRRARNTRNLSLIMLTLSVGSVSLWIAFAALVSNYSMLLWLSIVLIALLELTRLKLMERRIQIASTSVS